MNRMATIIPNFNLIGKEITVIDHYGNEFIVTVVLGGFESTQFGFTGFNQFGLFKGWK